MDKIQSTVLNRTPLRDFIIWSVAGLTVWVTGQAQDPQGSLLLEEVSRVFLTPAPALERQSALGGKDDLFFRPPVGRGFIIEDCVEEGVLQTWRSLRKGRGHFISQYTGPWLSFEISHPWNTQGISVTLVRSSELRYSSTVVTSDVFKYPAHRVFYNSVLVLRHFKIVWSN